MKKEQKSLEFFEAYDLGKVKGGNECNGNDNPLCQMSDTDWCKPGTFDCCGEVDTVCVPGLKGGAGHDGCCTGWFDFGGDNFVDINKCGWMDYNNPIYHNVR